MSRAGRSMTVIEVEPSHLYWRFLIVKQNIAARNMKKIHQIQQVAAGWCGRSGEGVGDVGERGMHGAGGDGKCRDMTAGRAAAAVGHYVLYRRGVPCAWRGV